MFKKLMTILCLVLALVVPAISANAALPVVKVPVPITGGAALSIIPFLTFTSLGAAAVYLIATDTPFPLCGFDGLTCYYQYPQRKS